MFKNDYKEWVCSIHEFLDGLGVIHYCLNDNVNILHIPNELEEKVLSKTMELGLLLHYHKHQTALYEGLFRGEKNFVGFSDGGLTISIEEPSSSDVPLDRIYYTMERVM